MGPKDQRQSLSEAIALSNKKCIYKVVFTGRPSKAHYEQDATMCVEATE